MINNTPYYNTHLQKQSNQTRSSNGAANKQSMTQDTWRRRTETTIQKQTVATIAPEHNTS